MKHYTNINTVKFCYYGHSKLIPPLLRRPLTSVPKCSIQYKCVLLINDTSSLLRPFSTSTNGGFHCTCTDLLQCCQHIYVHTIFFQISTSNLSNYFIVNLSIQCGIQIFFVSTEVLSKRTKFKCKKKIVSQKFYQF